MHPPAFNRFQNGFTHIFAGGYAAGYYSYKWAEVLSADAFRQFEENGIFDRDTGCKFLRIILEQGGSRDPMELFMEFRGREPTIDALLRHLLERRILSRMPDSRHERETSYENRHLEREFTECAPAACARLADVPQPDVLCLQETKLTDDNFPGRRSFRRPVITVALPGKKPTTGWRFSAASGR